MQRRGDCDEEAGEEHLVGLEWDSEWVRVGVRMRKNECGEKKLSRTGWWSGNERTNEQTNERMGMLLLGNEEGRNEGTKGGSGSG